jgi:hypothetical protein
MMRERRVLLSKHMAQLEMQGRMNSMKLSKELQDEFFRRYDMFEKKAFRTTNSFNRTKSSRLMGPLETTPAATTNSFYKAAGLKELSKEELIQRPFDRNVRNFTIKRGNPAYRSLSAMASIDNFKVESVDLDRRRTTQKEH